MPSDSNPIFGRAGVSVEEFYANAFVLNYQQLQQRESQRRCEVFQDWEDPRPIEDLIRGEVENDKKERLGKNLLDSFALIFAQLGGEGVVAAAMESNEDHTIHTLHISKNRHSIDTLTPPAEEIKAWFMDRVTDAANTVTLSRQSSLWRCILRNCYRSITRSIFEACIGDTEGEKKDELSCALRCIGRKVFDTLPSGLSKAKKGILNVLESLETFFIGSPSIYYKLWYLLGTNDVLNEEPIEFLHDFAQLCFNLAETRAQYMGDIFDILDERFRRESGDKPVKRRRALWKIRQLIYTISNYPRAWYDIVYFKVRNGSATLQINLQLGEGSITSEACKLIWDRISKIVIETRMLGEEAAAKMKGCYNSHLKLYPKWDPPDFLLKEQLQFLKQEMGRLADPTNTEVFIPERINSDSPDKEETFLSPRNVPGYAIESVE
ncbi:hypothetical protein F5Y00DRAFT_260888 [Daldinia vernicosa]|uniref:uncharacterized protein n=1 Tax=Daldinia vernicosa TaxID=114800 RepID=UPI002008362C|nr:uncharacterized protein F5Y00DRAFT_260888 [Daldinia vernicosa]KAI0850156.1 hypothetical protein F5Y00DRAFT_260888 [Daldinia vernicosa]